MLNNLVGTIEMQIPKNLPALSKEELMNLINQLVVKNNELIIKINELTVRIKSLENEVARRKKFQPAQR